MSERNVIEVGDVVDVEYHIGNKRHITQVTQIVGDEVWYMSETGFENHWHAESYKQDHFIRLVMKADVLEALEASIEHWKELIVKGGQIGSSSCPLCRLFLDEKTSKCNKPGYYCLLGESGRCCEEWRNVNQHVVKRYSLHDNCPECKRLSQVMLDKLISLHPFKEKYAHKAVCSICGIKLYTITHTYPNWINPKQPPLCESCWIKQPDKEEYMKMKEAEDKPRVVDNPDLTQHIRCADCSKNKLNTYVCTNAICPTTADLVQRVIDNQKRVGTVIKSDSSNPPKSKYEVGQWVKTLQTRKEFCIVEKRYLGSKWEYSDGLEYYWETGLEPAPEQVFKVGDKIKNVNEHVFMLTPYPNRDLIKVSLVYMSGNAKGYFYPLFIPVTVLNNILAKELLEGIPLHLHDNWLTNGRFTRVE